MMARDPGVLTRIEHLLEQILEAVTSPMKTDVPEAAKVELHAVHDAMVEEPEEDDVDPRDDDHKPDRYRTSIRDLQGHYWHPTVNSAGKSVWFSSCGCTDHPLFTHELITKVSPNWKKVVRVRAAAVVDQQGDKARG